MAKYSGFGHFFENRGDAPCVTFSELEEGLNIKLPKSARTYREWWANTQQNPQAGNGWLAGGYEVESVDIASEEVCFRRTDQEKEEDGTPGMRIVSKDEADRLREVEIDDYRDFEAYARDRMTDLLETVLLPGEPDEVPKQFDCMSQDGSILGDAKYYSMVNGESIPPAKFSTIAEHVWLLEKASARKRFLVFGNDRRVPEEWLDRYGHLVESVDFYFLEENGEPELLNG